MNKMNNNKTIPTVIGIDIGACTAKIASVQRGTVDVITNQANFRETPVVVGFGQGERKIGEIGNVKLKSNFKNTVVSPTRYLGLNASSQCAQRQLQNCPCPTKLQGQRVLFKVNVNGIDETFTAEQILAAFMTQLTSIIQHNNLDDKLIVFSVPSYFTEIEKKAFLNAAEISGLKNVKLVTEAVAIGMDYGSCKKSQIGDGKNVVFIDFGHSKLSLSLVKLSEAKLQVVLEKSNRNLGCRDIDRKVFEYMISKFEQKKGLNLKESKRACLKLLEAIQRQRKILSGISETEISIECLMEDEDFSESFTREIMINAASEIFGEINNHFSSFKQELQKMNIKVDAIELVGGGSRIPKFVELVEQVFETTASRTINSSETIATGATLAAVKESGLFRFNTLNVINRSASSLALSWKQIQGDMSEESEYPAINNRPILSFNEEIPAEKVLKIETSKKTSLLISYDILDEQVQKIVTQIQCEAPPQDKNQIALNFKINEDGFITLNSVQDNEGANIQFSVKYLNVLSSEEIAAFKAKQRQMFVKDFSIVMSYEKRNELQTFIYKQKEILEKPDFKKYVTVLEKENVDKYLTEITQSLENPDNKMGIKDYESKKEQILKQIKNLEESINRRKTEVLAYVKELEKLKTYAADVIKQITQRYRNSKPVSDTCQEIKSIYNWADGLIVESKNRSASELPLASNKEIEQQYENIKTLVNQLVNPQRAYQQQQQQQQRAQQQRLQQQKQQQMERQRQLLLQKQQQQAQRQAEEQQQQPRHIHYEQHYDPQARFRKQQYNQDPYEEMQRSRQRQNNLYSPRGTFYQEPQRPQYYQQPQPQPQRRRQQSQYYDPFGMSRSGFFGNMSGFW